MMGGGGNCCVGGKGCADYVVNVGSERETQTFDLCCDGNQSAVSECTERLGFAELIDCLSFSDV